MWALIDMSIFGYLYLHSLSSRPLLRPTSIIFTPSSTSSLNDASSMVDTQDGTVYIDGES